MNPRIFASLAIVAMAILTARPTIADDLAKGIPKPTEYTPSGPYATAFTDGKVKDPSRRKRAIAYRLTYPKDRSGATPVIIVSHGGSGDRNGHKSLAYLRLEYASRGYVVLNL